MWENSCGYKLSQTCCLCRTERGCRVPGLADPWLVGMILLLRPLRLRDSHFSTTAWKVRSRGCFHSLAHDMAGTSCANSQDSDSVGRAQEAAGSMMDEEGRWRHTDTARCQSHHHRGVRMTRNRPAGMKQKTMSAGERDVKRDEVPHIRGK